MKLSAPNRSVQEWEQTILQLVPEEDARIANRISNLIFGASFSQVLYGYYHERCQFLNSKERKLEGPFYDACDRFLCKKQEGILELSQEFVLKNFDVFNDTLHSLIIATARQYSKSEMKAIQSDIARYMDYFKELANGNTEFVDETIQNITEMLYEYRVYDDGSEEVEENPESSPPIKDDLGETDSGIVFDIESFERQSRTKPHLLFPGAKNRSFFMAISKPLKKQGFISSSELFVFRFFPLMDEEVDLDQPLIWYGEIESLLVLFRLFVDNELIADLGKTKVGKSLNQILSESFCDSSGASFKVNTLRKIARTKKIEHAPLETLKELTHETGTIFKIFDGYHS